MIYTTGACKAHVSAAPVKERDGEGGRERNNNAALDNLSMCPSSQRGNKVQLVGRKKSGSHELLLKGIVSLVQK